MHFCDDMVYDDGMSWVLEIIGGTSTRYPRYPWFALASNIAAVPTNCLLAHLSFNMFKLMATWAFPEMGYP